MLEEDCRSHAHRLQVKHTWSLFVLELGSTSGVALHAQTINAAANSLTHRLHSIVQQQRASASQGEQFCANMLQEGNYKPVDKTLLCCCC
jgi:hypothetical protein